MSLDLMRPPYPIATELSEVVTPLIADEWALALAGHPNQGFAQYILQGLMYGFRIDFSWVKLLSSVSCNIPSAYQHPEVVSTHIEKEVSVGNYVGSLTTKLAAVI